MPERRLIDEEPAQGLEVLRPALARRLASLSEPQQMVAVLRLVLDTSGPEELALVLAAVLDDHIAGRSGARPVLLAAGMMLAEPGAGIFHDDLLACARELGHPRLTRFLASPLAPSSEDDTIPKIAQGKDGRPLTLGERKSLARNPSRNFLGRLLADPSPEVVRNLLSSPKLTEADVIRIAARRPAPPAVLAEIASSRRWSTRYGVRLALVLNPSLDPALAIRLAALLYEQDRRRIASDPAVHPCVRRFCDESLRAPSIEWDLSGDESGLEFDPSLH